MSGCKKRVYGDSFGGRSCTRNAMPDSQYCKFHQPEAIAKRKEKLTAKWEAESKARSEKWNKEKLMDEGLEQALECLKSFVLNIRQLNDEHFAEIQERLVRMSERAIANAEGRIQ